MGVDVSQLWDVAPNITSRPHLCQNKKIISSYMKVKPDMSRKPPGFPHTHCSDNIYGPTCTDSGYVYKACSEFVVKIVHWCLFFEGASTLQTSVIYVMSWDISDSDVAEVVWYCGCPNRGWGFHTHLCPCRCVPAQEDAIVSFFHSDSNSRHHLQRTLRLLMFFYLPRSRHCQSLYCDVRPVTQFGKMTMFV